MADSNEQSSGAMGATGGTPPAAPSGATAGTPAPAVRPPPAAANLGPQLTEARAQNNVLQGTIKKLQDELTETKDALNVQREEVARLQGLLNQQAKSQLGELGEGAYEVGESATILGSVSLDGSPGRVHAAIGDVLVLDSVKPAALAKIKEKVATAVPGGKARVYVVTKGMLTELQELQLLRT